MTVFLIANKLFFIVVEADVVRFKNGTGMLPNCMWVDSWELFRLAWRQRGYEMKNIIFVPEQ
jgi:hypothetical protein